MKKEERAQLREDLAAYERWNNPSLEIPDRRPTDPTAIDRLLVAVPRLLDDLDRVEALRPPTSYNNEADDYGLGWADGAVATMSAYRAALAGDGRAAVLDKLYDAAAVEDAELIDRLASDGRDDPENIAESREWARSRRDAQRRAQDGEQ